MELFDAANSISRAWSLYQDDDQLTFDSATSNSLPYAQPGVINNMTFMRSSTGAVNTQLSGVSTPFNDILIDSVEENQPPEPFTNKGNAIGMPPRPQCTFVRPEDWEKARPVITELYQTMSLDQVMKEMEKRSFIASKKMFKARINKWGIEKKLKASEVLEMIRIRDERLASGKDTEFFLRGKLMPWSKVDQYLRRNKRSITQLQASIARRGHSTSALVHRTPSPEPEHVAAMPCITKVDLPEYLHLYDMLPKVFKDYVIGSIESGLWTISSRRTYIDGPEGHRGFIRLNRWTSRIIEGCLLIYCGKVQVGFALIHESLERTEKVLLSHEPYLLLKLYRSLMNFYLFDLKIGTEIASFFQKLVTKVLPQRHPLHLFWKHWDDFQTLNQYELLRRTFQAFIDSVIDTIDPESWMVESMIQSHLGTCLMLRESPIANLELEIRRIITLYRIDTRQNRNLHMDLNLQLAASLFRQDPESAEGTLILDRAEKLLTPFDMTNTDRDLKSLRFSWWDTTRLQYWLKKDWKNGYEFCRHWAQWSRGLYGLNSIHTLIVCNRVKDFGKRIGVTDLSKYNVDLDEIAADSISRLSFSDDESDDGNEDTCH